MAYIPEYPIPVAPDLSVHAQARQLALVADDDSAVRELVVHALERWGLQVLSASDGTQALALLRYAGDRLTCIVLDVMMPEIDGIEVALIAQQLGLQIPLVLMSGLEPELVSARLGQAGTIRILHKPFSLRELAAALQR